MSFIILILIILLLYASLSKYSNIFKVLLMGLLISGMTSAFIVYGIHIFRITNVFYILNTDLDLPTFINACAIWIAADIIVFFKIIKNYRIYVAVNSEIVRVSRQELE